MALTWSDFPCFEVFVLLDICGNLCLHNIRSTHQFYVTGNIFKIQCGAIKT